MLVLWQARVPVTDKRNSRPLSSVKHSASFRSPPSFLFCFVFFAQIAQQVTAGNAPKQKEPFRLWKSKTGEESYDKSKPS